MMVKSTIFDYLAEHVAVRPADIAYLHNGRTTTFANLSSLAAKYRAALRELGIVPGDRIALAMSDSPDLAVVLLAIMGLGAIAVPCSTTVKADELVHMICHPEPCCVIVSDDQLAAVEAILDLLPPTLPVLTIGANSPNRRFDLSSAAQDAVGIDAISLDPDAVAVILYTSGTTGYPKGAMHRHRDIPHIIEATGRGVYGIAPGDRIFSSARMFFSYGFSNSFSVPLGLGATCILSSERPTPQLIFRVFNDYRPTVFFSVPAVFRGLLEYHRAGHNLDISALRLSASGGEKLPPHIFQEWKAVTGTDILDVIGTTEVMYGVISNRPDRIKLGSSGLPIAGYEVKLVDESGQLIEHAGRGNLFVRGASISSHYWSTSGEAREALQDGWLKTGDIFSRDEDGFYFFEGRSDDLFKSSGMWVSPSEVEEAICAHPAVLEAAVVSLPAIDGGFESVAYVVVRSASCSTEVTAQDIASQDIASHLARQLPRYKRPQKIRFVEAIPRTATGKIQRFRLRAVAAEASTRAA